MIRPNGEGILAPDSYWRASKEEIRQRSNGCGPPTFLSVFVSNSIWGVDVSKACEIHDYQYSKKMSSSKRKFADYIFKENLFKIIDNDGGGDIEKLLKKGIANIYYYAVRLFGS